MLADSASEDRHNMPLSLKVTVEDGNISDIIITEQKETKGIADPA